MYGFIIDRRQMTGDLKSLSGNLIYEVSASDSNVQAICGVSV